MGRRGRLGHINNPWKTNAVDDAAFTIGAEASNVIGVTIQLKAREANTAIRSPLRVWLSDSASTGAVIATAPDGGVAAGASGAIVAAVVANKVLDCVTDAAGKLILNITHAAGAKTLYVYVQLPDGSMKVSSAVTFAV